MRRLASTTKRLRAMGIAAVLLAGCSGGQPPSGVPESADAGTVAPPSQGGARSFAPDASQAPGELPVPSLTDAVEVGAALWDPARVEQGVVSLVEQLGIDIFSAEGALVRDAAAEGPPGMWLFEAEVHGLIEMGRADAAAIAAGAVPFTLVDLYDGLSPVYPELTQAQLLDAYVQAYRAVPGDLVRESFAGHPFVPEAAFTRVHLWLFVLDGVIGRPQPATARTVTFTSGSQPARGSQAAGGPVARVQLPAPSAALAQLMALDLSALPVALAHLATVAYTLPVDFAISPSTVHEGHGAPGQPAALEVRSRFVPTPIVSPFTGLPLLVPYRTTLEGLPVSFESPGEATLNAHGTLSGMLGIPMFTDVLGTARLEYTPRTEPADGQGDLATDVAVINAVIEMRQIVLYMYAAGGAANLALGVRIIPQPLIVEWHEETTTPAPGTPGAWSVVLSGPRPGAGTYSGVTESLCSHPGGRWTAVGQPQGSTVTMFDLQENPAGFDSLTVSTAPTNDFNGAWFFDSKTPNMTTFVDGSSATEPPLVTGHATWVDSLGRSYSADVTVHCGQTF